MGTVCIVALYLAVIWNCKHRRLVLLYVSRHSQLFVVFYQLHRLRYTAMCQKTLQFTNVFSFNNDQNRCTCDQGLVFHMPLHLRLKHVWEDLGLKTASQYLSSTVVFSSTLQNTSLLWNPVCLAMHLD
jgi:hypothetical protein